MSIFGKLVATIPERPILDVSSFDEEVKAKKRGMNRKVWIGTLKEGDSRHGK
jgi:hypothetical protein